MFAPFIGTCRLLCAPMSTRRERGDIIFISRAASWNWRLRANGKTIESVKPATGRACESTKYLLGTELTRGSLETWSQPCNLLPSVQKQKKFESNGCDLHKLWIHLLKAQSPDGTAL